MVDEDEKGGGLNGRSRCGLLVWALALGRYPRCTSEALMSSNPERRCSMEYIPYFNDGEHIGG